jgi:hypothetical protein
MHFAPVSNYLGHESLDVTLAWGKDPESEAKEHANSSSLALYA